VVQAVVVTTSGGLVGGDVLRIRVRAGPGAAALVTTQAAEKVYRSAGADVRLDVALEAGAGAWLEWLPQETILFDGARLRRRTTLDLAPGARCLAAEAVVFGRVARGETLTRGLLHDAWTVRRDGRPVWCDATRLDGDLPARLAAPAGFGGARAAATLVYAAADAGAWLAPARELIAAAGGDGGDGLRGGVTLLPGLLVARWLATDPARLRRAAGAFWAAVRHRAAGLPARLPGIRCS
jgi:urease accessory protein